MTTSRKCPSCGWMNAPATPACICGHLFEEHNAPRTVATTAQAIGSNSVVVVDVQIPFGSMVTLLVKLAIAAVPALLLVALFWVGITFLFGALFGAFR